MMDRQDFKLCKDEAIRAEESYLAGHTDDAIHHLRNIATLLVNKLPPEESKPTEDS